jgi:1,4-dihydroxy-2-naphthoate octaprenyltransferase
MATGVAITVLTAWRPGALLALAAVPLAVPPSRLALSAEEGRALLPMLGATARLQMAVGALLTIGVLL